MSSLPSLSGQSVIKAFEAAGFSVVRIASSHHIMKKDGCEFLLAVPVHASKPVKAGTLRKLIRASGLTVTEFNDLC